MTDIIKWLEENDDGEYDIMVEDTTEYIRGLLGDNGRPESIQSKIIYYAMELVRDALYPLPVARLIEEQAMARYKEGLW